MLHPKTLQIKDQTLAYYESPGTGPSAILVHGNSSSGRAFQRQLLSPLGEQFHLIAIDLPGHGNSSPATDPESTYNAAGYTQTLVEAAKQLGLEDAVFVGWSLGGHIVIEASEALPRAAGLMVFGTPPLGNPPAMTEAFLPNPAMGFGFKPDLSEEEARAYVSAFFAPGFSEIPAFFIEDALQTDGRARGLLGASLAQGAFKDELALVAQLNAPLAILHGEQEQLVNGAYLNALEAPTLWRGAVQIIPQAGHAPHWEQPEQFNALLEAFLQETVG